MDKEEKQNPNNDNMEEVKDNNNAPKKEKDLNPNDKIKELEDRLARAYAEIENQRRRFEKEIKDAFEFGSFNFAKESLAILDNLSSILAQIASFASNLLKI